MTGRVLEGNSGLSSILHPLSNASWSFQGGVFVNGERTHAPVRRQTLSSSGIPTVRVDSCLAPSNGHPGHEHENTNPRRMPRQAVRRLSRAKTEKVPRKIPPRLEKASQPGNVVRMGSPSFDQLAPEA